MAIFKLLVVVFIGVFVRNAISVFNPMLTYSLRFKKIAILPNFTGNFYINRYRDTQYVNGQIKIESKELIDKVVAVFNRCDSEGINCEYFQTWEITDLCPKLLDKNQIWSRWHGSFDPPMICPLNKVNYRLNNATLDIGIMTRLYPEVTDYQWKLIQKMYSGNKYIGGYTVEASLFGYRKKRKSIPT